MNPETVTLTDASAGSSANVLVGFGFNCYSFSVRVGGEAIETLWSAPGFETGKERPSHSGIPLLFPYPGRLRGKTLEWQGRSCPLDGDDGRGNAIHGFVLNRPWKVCERSATRVVGEFHASQVDPEILKKWPADFRLTVSYELRGNTLVSTIEIANPDNKPLPFGLGTHPYFRVPLGAAGTAGDCVVTVPAKEIWELSDMVPTGKRLPADGRYNLAAGMKFADTKFDDVFTGLPSAGEHRATIRDPKTGRTLTMTFDRTFRECVVYNPPHREAICLEPYTCCPDYFWLEDHGIASGMRVLAPGERVEAKISITLS